MSRLFPVASISMLSVVLSGCVLLGITTETHLGCGMGTAPIPSYRSCMESAYRVDGFGGISASRMSYLLAVDDVASQVASGEMTQAQAYSYLGRVRAEAVNSANAHNRAVWADAMETNQQQQNQIYNNLLNNQQTAPTSDYWQVHQNGRTVQCRRFGNQVNCQ